MPERATPSLRLYRISSLLIRVTCGVVSAKSVTRFLPPDFTSTTKKFGASVFDSERTRIEPRDAPAKETNCS